MGRGDAQEAALQTGERSHRSPDGPMMLKSDWGGQFLFKDIIKFFQTV